MTAPSKSKIDRCGELVRQYAYEQLDIPNEQIDEALQIITEFRAAHA